MRVVKELMKEEIRISVFSWNNKYLLKFEMGPMEQTFKIPELDILEESDLNTFLEGDFFEGVKTRFNSMGQSFKKQLSAL